MVSYHKLIKIQRFSKTLKSSPRYVRKKCFKNFNKDEFKMKVGQMPTVNVNLNSRFIIVVSNKNPTN